MDVGTDGLEAEIVCYVVDGDWGAIWWGVGVGALYGHALYWRARVLDHTRLVSLGAVARDETANKYRVFKLLILFESRINESSAKVEVRVGGPMTSALVWDFTQRIFLVTDVSGKPISPIFTAWAVQEAIHVAWSPSRAQRSITSRRNSEIR